jgi:hypothetical protein
MVCLPFSKLLAKYNLQNVAPPVQATTLGAQYTAKQDCDACRQFSRLRGKSPYKAIGQCLKCFGAQVPTEQR